MLTPRSPCVSPYLRVLLLEKRTTVDTRQQERKVHTLCHTQLSRGGLQACHTTLLNLFLQCFLRWPGHSRRAETMISEEIESVQNEADEIEPGWSQSIWPLAMQLR